MAMTDAKVNYNFEESEVGKKQVKVTNSFTRTQEHLELVLISGYFGEVREFDGIVNGADGVINIDDERLIGTTQINTGDTFVLGNGAYFTPGTNGAAGTVRATAASGRAHVGMVTKINNGVSVEFKPFVQRLNVAGIVVA